jgi:toxin ParE1/3/4
LVPIIWTPEALRNLEVIDAYMRRVAPDYAQALVTGILAAVDPVAMFPHIGRMVPGFDRDSLREVIFENYRVVYVIREDAIFVTRVFHGSMDVGARLGELDQDV